MSLGTSAGRVSRTSSKSGRQSSRRSRGRRGSWMDAQSVEIPTFLGLKSQMQRSRTKMLEMDNASSTGSTKAGAQGDLQEGGFASSRESRRSITSIDTQSLGPFTSPSTLSWARTSLQVAVRSSGFDWATAIMVSLNAVFIGWRTEYAAQHQTEEEPEIYHVVDVLFLLAFGFEAALRFVAEGPRRFCLGKEWRWNLFDVLTVSTQIYEEIEVLSGRSGGNFSYLRIFRLRLLRLFRILRIVRVLRFVRELRTLVYSIACSLQSLVWTLILILFMLYIVGVFFTQVVLNYMRDDAARAAVEAQTTATLERRFGSLGASVISLFQAMSGGVDWHELSGPLASIHWSFQILFASYIAFAVLAMMNVVTGVFVDNAINGSKKDTENDIAVRLMDFCKSCDTDGDGKLSLDELEMHLKKPAFADTLNSIGLNTIDTKNLFTLLDVDDDGEIDWEDMVLGCLRLRGPAKSVDVVTLMYDTKRSMWKLQDQVDEVLRFIQQEPHQLRAAARS